MWFPLRKSRVGIEYITSRPGLDRWCAEEGEAMAHLLEARIEGNTNREIKLC